MYLIPALGGGTCDALVLYFQSHYRSSFDNVVIGGFWGWMNIYKTGYITFQSIIRITLLCVPLAYRRYTGTRVKYAVLYYLFHGLCALAIVFHMLAIVTLSSPSEGDGEEQPLDDNDDDNKDESDYAMILDKYESDSNKNKGNVMRSLLDLLQKASSTTTTTTTTTTSTKRKLWIILSLSLTSIFLHVVILLHLHSSAPNTDSSLDPKVRRNKQQKKRQRRRMMSYYAYNTYTRAAGDTANNNLAAEGNDNAAAAAATATASGLQGEDQNKQHIPLLLSYDLDDSDHRHNHTMNDDEGEELKYNDSNANLSQGAPNLLTQSGINVDSDPKPFGASSGGPRGGAAATIGGGAIVKKFSDMKQCLPEDFDDFMSELQTRLQTAQEQWSHRLNEFSLRIQQSNNNNNNNLPSLQNSTTNIPLPVLMPRTNDGKAADNDHNAPSSQQPIQQQQHHHHHHRFLQLNLSPFRVLLQLFAYEEVLSNHRLDAVWDMDNGIALTFYVPQLLSFLLHGAFWNTKQLENWILDKCTKNVHFAHRCFWFLRSWCLGEGKHCLLQDEQQQQQQQSISTVASDGNLFLHIQQHEYSSPAKSTTSNNNTQERKRCGSESNLSIHSNGNHNSTSKFPQEEHSLIEELLFRVMECGEMPATKLYYDENAAVNNTSNYAICASGTAVLQNGETSFHDHDHDPAVDDTDSTEDDDEEEDADLKPLLPTITSSKTKSFDSKISKNEDDFIPVNPADGYPSVKHLNVVTAKRTFGFLPLSSFHDDYSDNDEKKVSNVDAATTTPDFLSSPYPQQQPLLSPFSNNQESRHHFLATPRFLDALTAIADDLFLITQRENRTKALRKALQKLEIEHLPSNSIYIPFCSGGNHYHRIWRIVSDESIALSTKERVPCIVTLEVINYDPPTRTSAGSIADIFPRGKQNVVSPTSQDSCNSANSDKFESPHSPFTNTTPNNSFTASSTNTTTEADILNAWYKNPRQPQRHNTILDKVSTYTQQTIHKIQKQGNEIGNNVAGKWGNLIQRTGGNNRVGDGATEITLQQYDTSTNNLVVEVNNEHQEDNDVEAGMLLPIDSTNDEDNHDNVDLLSGLPPPPLTVVENDKKKSSRSNDANRDDSIPSYKPTPIETDTSVTTETAVSPSDKKTGKTLSKDINTQAVQSLPVCPSTPEASEKSEKNTQKPPSPASAMGQWSSPTPPPSSSPSKMTLHYSKGGGHLRKRTTTTDKKKKQQKLNDSKKHSRKDSKDEGVVLHYGSTHHQEIDNNDSNGGDNIVMMNDDLIAPTLKTMERIQYNDGGNHLQNDEEYKRCDVESATKQSRNSTSNIITSPTATTTSSQRPPLVVFKEDWKTKEERLRSKSAFGHHPGWRLLPILVKSNDDLRQEQLASQLIQRMAMILAKGKVPVWLYPYEIIALTDRGGIIEAIPDTISVDSLKRNDPEYTDLKSFFLRHFGPAGSDEHANAKANFVESLAAYSMVCFLLQIKDRHNGNILLDNKGHLIHIDFGFFFLSSPGKNSGFESAPFKLTRDFVDLMDGPESRTFAKFRDLCYKTFLELRKHCYQITLTVEMLMEGNEDLACFLGRPEDAVHELKERFRLDLNDRACLEYVNSLVNESLENWRTRWYDRYQRFCVGVL